MTNALIKPQESAASTTSRHTVERISPHAKLPTRNYQDDVGMDIYSAELTEVPAYSTKLVGTGIKVKPADGTWLQIESRSGMAINGISVIGGIIDPKYRGEIRVVLVNHAGDPYEVHPGDKIAQLVERPVLIHAAEEGQVDDTQRGAKGFGSSGR